MPLAIFRKRKSTDASRLRILWPIALIGLATIVALLVTSYLRDKRMDWLPSLLSGATAGVMGVWFLFRSIWPITMRVTRGAPFHIGDRVKITDGEHQGATGTVSEVFEDRYSVRVKLEIQTDTKSNPIFNWSELRRVSVK